MRQGGGRRCPRRQAAGLTEPEPWSNRCFTAGQITGPGLTGPAREEPPGTGGPQRGPPRHAQGPVPTQTRSADHPPAPGPGPAGVTGVQTVDQWSNSLVTGHAHTEPPKFPPKYPAILAALSRSPVTAATDSESEWAAKQVLVRRQLELSPLTGGPGGPAHSGPWVGLPFKLTLDAAPGPHYQPECQWSQARLSTTVMSWHSAHQIYWINFCADSNKTNKYVIGYVQQLYNVGRCTRREDKCREMASMLFFCPRKDKPKQLHKLIERNLLSFAQIDDKDHKNQLHHRINKWLRESRDESKRHDWRIFACCNCFQPQYISDSDTPEPGLQDWLPRRDSDVFTD